MCMLGKFNIRIVYGEFFNVCFLRIKLSELCLDGILFISKIVKVLGYR